MKIIEALKSIKMLEQKCSDLRKKISDNCCQYDYETPVYTDEGTQRQQIQEWMQSHHDSVKEILRLRTAIQRTNLATEVTIDLGNGSVTKTIAEWVHRRRDLAKLEQSMWSVLADGQRREGRIQIQGASGEKQVTIRRYFDPAERDQKIEFFRNEPMKIDSTLETVNATTDLLE